MSYISPQQKGHKKRESVHRSSAQEVCTTRRGHEWKQFGTITPESTRGVVCIRLYANNITRNNIW
jgi:N-acetylglucosamine-6-phosphate deacetylase